MLSLGFGKQGARGDEDFAFRLPAQFSNLLPGELGSAEFQIHFQVHSGIGGASRLRDFHSVKKRAEIVSKLQRIFEAGRNDTCNWHALS